MSDKVRTNIYLDKETLKELKRLAYEADVSIAAVVRIALDEYLHKKSDGRD